MQTILILILFITHNSMYDYTNVNSMKKNGVYYDKQGNMANGSYAIMFKQNGENLIQYGRFVDGRSEGTSNTQYLDGRSHSVRTTFNGVLQPYPRVYYFYKDNQEYIIKSYETDTMFVETHYWYYPKQLLEDAAKAYSQTNDDNHVINKNDRKQIKKLVKYEKTIIDGIETKVYYYTNGEKKIEEITKRIKNDGSFGDRFQQETLALTTKTYYFTTGDVQKTESFINHMYKHGEFKTYNALGNLVEKLVYDVNVKSPYPKEEIKYNIFGKKETVTIREGKSEITTSYLHYHEPTLDRVMKYKNNTFLTNKTYYANGNLWQETNTAKTTLYHPITKHKVAVYHEPITYSDGDKIDYYDVQGRIFDKRNHMFKGKTSPIDEKIFKEVMHHFKALSSDGLPQNYKKEFTSDLYVNLISIFYQNRPIDGEFIFVDEDNIVKKIYSFREGKLKTIKEFSNRGFVKMEQSYSNHFLSSEELFFETGLHKSSRYNRLSQLHGRSIIYHKNGLIASVSNYSNGKKFGIHKKYDASGNLTKESKFQNGILVKEKSYKNGLMIVKEYEDNNELITDLDLVTGEYTMRRGDTHELFYFHGVLKQKMVMKDQSILHKNFYENGNLKSEYEQKITPSSLSYAPIKNYKAYSLDGTRIKK